MIYRFALGSSCRTRICGRYIPYGKHTARVAARVGEMRAGDCMPLQADRATQPREGSYREVVEVVRSAEERQDLVHPLADLPTGVRSVSARVRSAHEGAAHPSQKRGGTTASLRACRGAKRRRARRGLAKWETWAILWLQLTSHRSVEDERSRGSSRSSRLRSVGGIRDNASPARAGGLGCHYGVSPCETLGRVEGEDRKDIVVPAPHKLDGWDGMLGNGQQSPPLSC